MNKIFSNAIKYINIPPVHKNEISLSKENFKFESREA